MLFSMESGIKNLYKHFIVVLHVSPDSYILMRCF